MLLGRRQTRKAYMNLSEAPAVPVKRDIFHSLTATITVAAE